MAATLFGARDLAKAMQDLHSSRVAKSPDPTDRKQADEFSPREFLRARRPEQFSDSFEEPVSELDRSMLEYHLGTLTNRSQELDFERFARLLCEQEVCPNLLPHTGPTGGGDSKVDSETYPVADALTFAWFSGTGRSAAQERWGFAFSAKADWRAKVKADAEKIASTERGYRRVFFVTNQYVADRVRAGVEDEIRRRFHFEASIFDRSWILDRVFAGHHEDLAIAELKVTALKKSRVVKGPQDIEADRKRAAVEARIKEAASRASFGHDYVADCIEAARLARETGKPREEIEGCFARARRAAVEHGSSYQLLCAVYQEAWTAYWWFEDFASVSRLYAEIERQATGSINPSVLEMWSNIWTLLFPLCESGKIDPIESDMKGRTERLSAELERLANERERPSASLLARTFRLHIRLMKAYAAHDSESAEATFDEIAAVVRESEGLVGYPLEPVVQIVKELGSHAGELPAYDRLFEAVVEVSARQKGDAAAARLLCQRGADQLDADKGYDAIRTFGRALSRLYQHETRQELVVALTLCANAYSRVGLLWAARGTLLAAASIAASEFFNHERITFAQAACFHELKVIELKLGRVPHFLGWHEIERAVLPILAARGRDVSSMTEMASRLDGMLGILMLKADMSQLARLTRFPAALGRMGLNLSGLALRFALGDEAAAAAGFSPESVGGGGVQSFFRKWRDQPGARQVPPSPMLCDRDDLRFVSRILGCQIELTCENRTPCVETAESLLAALESLLATGLPQRLFSREPVLQVLVTKVGSAPVPFDFNLTEPEGRPQIDVRCADFNPHSLSREQQDANKEKLEVLLALVLARVFAHGDEAPALRQIFGEERALERAISFTSSFVTAANVLGPEPKTRLEQWLEPADPACPLTRREAWDASDRIEAPRDQGQPPEVGPATGEQSEAFDPERFRQDEIATLSLIRESLWNEARWIGAAFVWDPAHPPFLCLAFENEGPAMEIFSHWRKELGQVDRDEKLRVLIVQGISRQNPHSYRMMLSPDPHAFARGKAIKQFALLARGKTVDPASGANLANFIAAYRRHGSYFLAPAIFKDGALGPEPKYGNAIHKRALNIRSAWKIGRNDLDAVGVLLEDDPIIPASEAHAPVTEILKERRENSQKKHT